ncbi:hypothetical protein D9M71_624300 [compost metagenome]
MQFDAVEGEAGQLHTLEAGLGLLLGELGHGVGALLDDGRCLGFAGNGDLGFLCNGGLLDLLSDFCHGLGLNDLLDSGGDAFSGHLFLDGVLGGDDLSFVDLGFFHDLRAGKGHGVDSFMSFALGLSCCFCSFLHFRNYRNAETLYRAGNAHRQGGLPGFSGLA